MKISCQSCQAKYTIADEKVLGKVVKIRCKKCGSTIVINGNEGAPQGLTEGSQAGATEEVSQAGTVGEWTVNVADGDQRTMTAKEIVDEFRAGVINDETYCWRDGMADWLPLREIDELSALVKAKPAAAASPATTSSGRGSRDLEGGAAAARGLAGASASFGSNGASPNFTPAAALPPVAANASPLGANPPAAARRTGGRGGADLFGAAALAGGEDDVMTSVAAAGAFAPGMDAGGDTGKMTGQRNENSVLFSLNALTQGSTPPGEGPSQTATTEGSGLIDIRALSVSMGKENGTAKASHVDDIMNLGGGGAFSAALAAPVLSAPSVDHSGGSSGEAKGNKVLFAIIGAGALIALAIVVVFALKKPDVPETTVTTTPTAVPTETAAPTSETTAPGADTAAPVGSAAAPAAPGTGQAVTAVRVPTRQAAAAAAAPAAPKPADDTSAAPVAAAPVSHPSLGDALKKEMGGNAPSTAAPAAAGGTAPFDRGAAAGALGSVTVASCKKGDGPSGPGHVKITFAPNGTVSTAQVDAPPYEGTPVGGCIAGKFRGARIPPFAGSPVTVGKSFVLN